MRRALALIGALTIGAAPVAWAQDRGQTMIDLARVLGEAHALRQICEGPSDYFWRDKMLGFLAAEAPGEEMDARLREVFHDGYEARAAQFRDCTPDSRDASRRVRALGSRLSRRLVVEPPVISEKLAPG